MFHENIDSLSAGLLGKVFEYFYGNGKIVYTKCVCGGVGWDDRYLNPPKSNDWLILFWTAYTNKEDNRMYPSTELHKDRHKVYLALYWLQMGKVIYGLSDIKVFMISIDMFLPNTPISVVITYMLQDEYISYLT